MFKGILINKDDAGYRAAIAEIDEAQLPEGDVTAFPWFQGSISPVR